MTHPSQESEMPAGRVRTALRGVGYTDAEIDAIESSVVQVASLMRVNEVWAKRRGRFGHRVARFRKWWAAFRHVPHPRSVWCGDRRCPYAVEAIR